MKRIFTILVAAFALASCTQDEVVDPEIKIEKPTYYASFADTEAESRTYLDEDLKLLWHNGDRISLFATTYNEEYAFVGTTGSNSGAFEAVDNDSWVTGNPISTPYAVYPYNENNALSNSEVLTIYFQAEQTYMENSFGRGANTMVAAAESATSKLLPFRNAGGYLMLKLYGEGAVKSIELKGNNEEILSGAATAEAKYGYLPLITMGAEGGKNITLTCENAVELGATEAEATVFWLVVPPITFEKGFTITVTDAEGGTFVQATSKEVVIERNEIKSMAALAPTFEGTTEDPEGPKPAKNEIWYTNGSTTEATAPYKTDVFGANIESNTYDVEKECWVIKFDGNVTSIGYMAFYSCSSLTSITIGNSVTSIGDGAFQNCSSLTTITIPDSVTSIGDRAFSYCSSLTSITIGNSVTSIGGYAFNKCSSLTSITIPDSVTSIGNYAFYYCSSLTSVTIGDSVTSIGERAFAFSGLESITIPDSVISIGDDAFRQCRSLTSVTIGNSVTSIGNCAFFYCNLTSVTIPDSVISIGDDAFRDCGSLTSVTIGASVTSIGDYAFQYCYRLTSITIPDSVTSIGSWAFDNCIRLTSVTIGNSVTSIGDSAFTNCSSLTAFYGKFASEDNRCLIVNGVLNSFAIGCGATEYTIPDSVTEIRVEAFIGCRSLTSITIPDSVTSIGEYAFYNCSNLTEVYCKPTTPPTGGDYMFDYSWRKIYVPTASVSAYKAAKYWSDYADYIVDYDF